MIVLGLPSRNLHPPIDIVLVQHHRIVGDCTLRPHILNLWFNKHPLWSTLHSRRSTSSQTVTIDNISLASLPQGKSISSHWLVASFNLCLTCSILLSIPSPLNNGHPIVPVSILWLESRLHKRSHDDVSADYCYHTHTLYHIAGDKHSSSIVKRVPSSLSLSPFSQHSEARRALLCFVSPSSELHRMCIIYNPPRKHAYLLNQPTDYFNGSYLVLIQTKTRAFLPWLWILPTTVLFSSFFCCWQRRDCKQTEVGVHNKSVCPD